MKNILSLFIVFVSFNVTLLAQDQVGLKLSTMMPVQTARLNPSAIVDQRPFLDVEVVGFGGVIDNNYLYAPKEETSIIRNQFPDEASDVFDEKVKSFYGDLTLFLPSFTISKGRFSYGLRTGLRTYANAKDVPYHLAKFSKEGFEYEPLEGQGFSSAPFHVAAASWLEIGGQFGMIVHQKDRNMISAGISIQRLSGITGIGMYVNSLDYNVPNDTLFNIEEVSGELAVTDPGFNTGTGWGFDLGVTFQKKLESLRGYTPHSKSSACTYIDYKWKLGVSIVDIGRINFKSQTYTRSFSGAFSEWENIENETTDDAAAVADMIDDNVEGDISEGSSYKMRLPTSLNVQFDYNLENNFRIGAIGNFGIPANSAYGLERLDYIAVIPRYEQLRFEVAVPISMNNYARPKLGAMLRLGPLAIGTDNIIPWLLDVDIYNLDFYFTLHIRKFNSNECKAAGVNWRVNDCTAPSTRRTYKDIKRDNRKRYKRNRRKQKRYLN